MRVVCAAARPFVLVDALDGQPPPLAIRQHVQRCLRCQALAARTRASARSLRTLAAERRHMPAFSFGGVLAALPGESAGEPMRSWSPIAAGAAALVVAFILVRRRFVGAF